MTIFPTGSFGIDIRCKNGCKADGQSSVVMSPLRFVEVQKEELLNELTKTDK